MKQKNLKQKKYSMTEKRSHRTFTPEFKSQVVRLYESGKSRTDLIREYDFTVSSLGETKPSFWLFQRKGKKTFEELTDRLNHFVEKYGVKKPIIDMCVRKDRRDLALVNSNTILLSTELIKPSKYCIEYVILHEIIHFKYNDHSEKFYNMLNVLMPDWQKRKKILAEEAVRELEHPRIENMI